ncbi:PMP-22/EMP/MP20/Claudin tight junction [Biomphalaria glabrata]|uniref:Uncharacterized protein LOC106052023 n=2 Tax=Biomphalaria TaxID=6525 RepID=A0A2C9M1U4_BIOGL|nr:uncharacterized protein LOC106052023 [Biomphalaria glabrata]KAI8730590.1 hypothetical protein BgiMline_030935 [Biomphalaria glabrata]KAI8764535.1 hypothetical protein BgiBS90_029920 [Biomphalaria glabrata]KAK0066366.1 hypothetical protein Bpfe_004487 [Biomphalaria pfeifferi]
MGNSGRVTGWTIAGTILIGVSIIALLFASAYPYWQQAEKTRDTGIPSIGLWSICFRADGYPAPSWANDILGNRYYGCNYVFDRDLRKIVDWIYPAWFKAVVIFVTLGLITQPLCIILNILYYARMVSAYKEHRLLLVSSIINANEGLLVAIAIIIFGIMSAKDAKWLPMPESNHLSYSYAVCAIVPVLCFFAAMCHTVDFLRIKSYKDRDARAQTYARGEFARY